MQGCPFLALSAHRQTRVSPPPCRCRRSGNTEAVGRISLFTSAFRETLAAARIETVRRPPHSLNLNAVAKRFVRTIKESCLEQVILIGEASLRRAIRNPAFAAIPTVVFTSLLLDNTTRSVLPAHDYLMKPVTFDQLLHVTSPRVTADPHMSE